MGTKLTYEEFIDKANIKNKGFTIFGDYINATTGIETHCSFGHIWFPTPHNLMYDDSGCPYCAGKKAWRGETDLWTTRPDIAKMLKNPNDGYKYTKGSGKKVDFICPDCGAINNKVIDMVCRYGFVCNRCSDGVSYPNKFGRAVLEQLCGDNFQCEYHPDWAKPYSYDNYFEHNGEKYILEMDGAFHYQEFEYLHYSLESRKNSDMIKDELAKNHDIGIIRIDCRKSDCTYIKNNILNSKLNEIFDLSGVNWNLCDINAQKNLIHEVCRLYSEGMHDLSDIKNKLHISLWAVQKYIKIGSDAGLCDYTVEKSRQVGREKRMVAVEVVDDANNAIHQFHGIRECARLMEDLYHIKFNSANIIKSCKTYKPYKGFNFRYAK